MKVTYYVAIKTDLALERAIISQEGLDIKLHQLKHQHPGVSFADFMIHINKKRRVFNSNSDNRRFGFENWLDDENVNTDLKKINAFSHNEALQNNTLLMALGDYIMLHNFSENTYGHPAVIVPSHFEIDQSGVHLVFRIDLPQELENDDDLQYYTDEIEQRLLNVEGLDATASKTIRVLNDLNTQTAELQTLLDEKLVLAHDFKPKDADIIIENNEFSLTPEAEDLFLTDTGKVKLLLSCVAPIVK